MKLRLVREDGTAATIEDLIEGFNHVEIDGVPMAVVESRGSALDCRPHRPRSSTGRLTIGLAYSNHARTVYDPSRSFPGITYVKDEYDCPFAARRRAREANAAPRIEVRRRRERTEWRP